MRASVRIENLTKTFGTIRAVDGIDLEIPDGKLACLLGPSGCGKTTLLRLIAGLEVETAGRILVDGEDQAGRPAHKRDFGMVFQSLALFPHLSVAENIAYPLRIRGVGPAERRERASELLDLVQLPHIEDRAISQLSGGQRQRVAIARGLAIDPKLFLLDEPLSALDAKLREHMQIELRQLQQKLKVTTIVVTHDQREAMTMADIVIVMDRGRVQQAGPPIDIYRHPANAFVADFIGSTNLIPCTVRGGRSIDVFGHVVQLGDDDVVHAAVDSAAILSVRPEDIAVLERPNGRTVTGDVAFIRDLGASVEISVQAEGQDIRSVCTPNQRPDVTVGQTVGLEFHTGRCTVMAS